MKPRRRAVGGRVTVVYRGVLSVVLLATAACDRPLVSPRPPVAEFLLAAGDSTYWVRSGPAGIRVRSAPILLTRTDNHLHEVYLVDDSRDFERASFAWARLFSRDIARDDSVLLFDDGAVLREANAWSRAHPQARVLTPDDIPDTDDPPTLVSDDLEILDVHGPWLTFGHTLDVDIEGRRSHLHHRRRGVLDVRDGQRASLGALFGATDAARIGQTARAAFASLSDSIRATTDERGALARRTLASFAFDSLNFGLTDVERLPAVAFVVPGTGEEGEALSLFLPPIVASTTAWWSGVQPTLPGWSPDSSALRWLGGAYDIIARPSAGGESLAIVLAPHDASPNPREWAIAVVPSPAYQLIPLDAPPLDSALRLALARAFDQSSSQTSSSRRVTFERPPRKRRIVHLTANRTQR